MKAYSTREVAELLGMTPAAVRAFAQAGVLSPDRGPRREYRFSFQDIVLLRTAVSLDAAQVPRRKLWRALRSLQETLPEGRSLATVRIAAQGDEVVVCDRDTSWQPVSGQVTFDFDLDIGQLACEAAPMVRNAAEAAGNAGTADAGEWYALGLDLETVGAWDRAAQAYARAIEADRGCDEAMINLGRLHHDAGRLDEAEKLYRAALEIDAADAVGWFNLGVVLDDGGDESGAIAAYERAASLDDTLADVHYNLARLHEAAGRTAPALRHLNRYRALR